MKSTILLVVALAATAGAQTFEVASVKPAAPGGKYAMNGGPGTGDPGQITYTHVSLKALVTKAYGVERYQVEAPPWLDDQRFDIAAKVPAGTTKQQFQQMLQGLLAERFGLVEHRETKDLPIYALVVGKGGPKLKVSGPEPEATGDEAPVNRVSMAPDGLPMMPAGYRGHMLGMKVGGKWMLRTKGESLAEFATFLTGQLDRPVYDFTGLTEKYDFGIAWSEVQALPQESNLPAALEPGPDVFAALQATLGLKLDPRKSPVEMVVVDRVERIPTAN